MTWVCAQIDPKKLPVRQQGYSAAFDMEFMNGSRLKVMFYICYSVPRRIATETGHKYEWDLVTRDHCKNGCPVRHSPFLLAYLALVLRNFSIAVDVLSKPAAPHKPAASPTTCMYERKALQAG